jgi:hypothetical protein
MRGEFIAVWSETWREIWAPLVDQGNIPGDIFCELYRELHLALRMGINGGALVEIVENPIESHAAFRVVVEEDITDERALIAFLEATHQILDDLGGDTLSNRYFHLLTAFIEKYNLRYDLRRPCLLCPTLPGLFASLLADLRAIASRDAHLDALMRSSTTPCAIFASTVPKAASSPASTSSSTCSKRSAARFPASRARRSARSATRSAPGRTTR